MRIGFERFDMIRIHKLNELFCYALDDYKPGRGRPRRCGHRKKWWVPTGSGSRVGS